MKKTYTEKTMQSSAGRWMFSLGALLLLSGIYGALRIIHVSVRKVPYPSSGVLPTTILFGQSSISFGRETDCDPSPQIYYEQDGKTAREATEQEKAVEEQLSGRCTRGFDEDRAKTKQYDRNLSAFLIFVGAGLMVSRRFLH